MSLGGAGRVHLKARAKMKETREASRCSAFGIMTAIFTSVGISDRWPFFIRNGAAGIRHPWCPCSTCTHPGGCENGGLVDADEAAHPKVPRREVFTIIITPPYAYASTHLVRYS